MKKSILELGCCKTVNGLYKWTIKVSLILTIGVFFLPTVSPLRFLSIVFETYNQIQNVNLTLRCFDVL